MTTYLVIAVVVLSLLCLTLATLNIIDQSEKKKELEERYARIKAHETSLLNEINRIQSETVYKLRVNELKQFTEWERKHDQIKYCGNCLSDQIEKVYLEMDYDVPAQAIIRCNSCGVTIAEFKKDE